MTRAIREILRPEKGRRKHYEIRGGHRLRSTLAGLLEVRLSTRSEGLSNVNQLGGLGACSPGKF